MKSAEVLLLSGTPVSGIRIISAKDPSSLRSVRDMHLTDSNPAVDSRLRTCKRMNNFVTDGGQVFCSARFGKQLKRLCSSMFMKVILIGMYTLLFGY
jgi:hypothetical protein